jgi:hypothetical protein
MTPRHLALSGGGATLGAIALLAAFPAPAAPIADGGVTAAQVAGVLQARGYQAQTTKDSEGDPLIRSGAEGSSFSIFFYGCKAGVCSSIQFSTAFHVEGGLTLARINNWNSQVRFGQAFLDKTNDPFIQMDLDVEHGYSTEAIANNLDTWVAVLHRFKTFIDCSGTPPKPGCPAENAP